jgi:hypothetical protein
MPTDAHTSSNMARVNPADYMNGLYSYRYAFPITNVLKLARHQLGHYKRRKFYLRRWHRHFENESKKLGAVVARFAPYTVIKSMATDLFGMRAGRLHEQLYCCVYRCDFPSIRWPSTPSHTPVNRIYPFWENRTNPWILTIRCPAPTTPNTPADVEVVLIRSQSRNGDVGIPRLSVAQTHILREYISTDSTHYQTPQPSPITIITLPHPFTYNDWNHALYRMVTIPHTRHHWGDGLFTSDTTLMSWRRIDPDWAYRSGLYPNIKLRPWTDCVEIVSDDGRPVEDEEDWSGMDSEEEG